MRIQLLSDLHLEFHRDLGKSFVNSLDPKGIDVLVLAGDIDVGENLPYSIGLLCQRFHDAKVLYVHGNHEFYGSNLERVRQLTSRIVGDNHNLTWLDKYGTRIGGIPFWGATLWFPHTVTEKSVKDLMNDFFLIKDFEAWVYRENLETVGFFKDNVKPGDIVITHHMPSYRCIAPRFAYSSLNPFFVSDLTDLIEERSPRLWMHGHTHDSVDMEIEKTKVLCNPFGYARGEINLNFNEKLVIEV